MKIAAFIPQQPGVGRAMTAALVAQFSQQGCEVVVDDGPGWWTDKVNKFLDASTADYEIVSNNDVKLGPKTVDMLVTTLAKDGLAAASMPAPDAGWLFCLRQSDGWRLDSKLKWWFSDTDLWRRMRDNDERILVVHNTGAVHLHPNKATASSPLLQFQAAQDQKTYERKWA